MWYCVGNILQWQNMLYRGTNEPCHLYFILGSYIGEMKQDKEFGKVGGEERHIQYRIVSKYGFCRNIDQELLTELLRVKSEALNVNMI